MRRVATTLGLLLTLSPNSKVKAQVLASEPGKVAQTIDGTTTTVTYHRPRARGRRGLFGSRVHWGEIWTPGANQSTKLTVSKDVLLEGHAVPKGSYSVWIVNGREAWEMVLDKDTTLYHTQGPKARPGQIRFPVNREKRPFMETLTWWFPELSSSGATLALQWDTVYVGLRLHVPPSYVTVVKPDIGRRLAGVYQLHFEPMPVSKDTTLTESESPATDVTFTIRQERTELRAVMDPPLFKSEGGYRDWIVLPTKGGWFTFGRFQDGELVEIFDFFQIQFDSAGAVAKGFEIRTPNDQLMGKGTRR